MIHFPRGKKIAILIHHNADIDAIGSATALLLGFGQKNIKATIGIPNSIARQAKKLLIYSECRTKINPDLKDFDVIFVLDTAVPEQLYPIKIPEDKEIYVIDHHENTRIRGTEEFISPRRKATCEMMLKVLKDNNVKIDRKIANLLLAGIVSDTNHFMLADKITFKLVVELLNYNADLRFVLNLVNNPPEFSERLAKLRGSENLEIYKHKDNIIVFSEVQSHEAAVARGLLSLGADVSIVFIEKDDELRVSARANRLIVSRENLNLGQDIFSKLHEVSGGNGGGHDAAGSLNTSHKEKKTDIKKFIFERLEDKLGKLEKV
jgi:nanoRNase/pAp phosphatase (c-di-AMP/oligoRNAs hydrolase)